MNQGVVQRSKNGIELNSPYSPDKQIAIEERKCGIPVEDPFPMEAPINTSLEGEGKVEMFSGNLASPASWPWLVSLQFEKKHFCVGILIEKTWVLTAGHCNVSTQTDKAILGITDLLPGTEGGTQISVKAVYFHTNLSGFPPSNDISLLELEIPVETGTISGEITFLRVGSPEDCNKHKYHSSQMMPVPDTGVKTLKTLIYVDVLQGQLHVMYQDLGGPLICKIDGRYKLIGLVSWGSDHCEPESPIVYTQISVYKNWISTVIIGKL
ncbi:hypothetical protein Chor_009868 [Crotalus horridus]